MAKVTIYTRPMCGYCVRALALLTEKGADIEEISAAFEREKREEMLAKSNGKTTYPQIFIGDMHIGGSDELLALERAGKLDPLLNA
ncbi:MAG: glutaredoxin 3 [Hyphococcus sp.]|nr:MAG: glutaredoxin 3 [Marinicaulis sp.]